VYKGVYHHISKK